ncbi:MAG: hypothetical protein M1546_14410, partial [Chloroflexi bacterium]|nr:hypothetical protein [Chloroflexota bacterium]
DGLCQLQSPHRRNQQRYVIYSFVYQGGFHALDLTTEIHRNERVNASERPIDIQNVGTGVANNVWGVMLPYVEPTNQVPPQLSMRNSVPLPAGAIKTMLFTAGGTVFDNQDLISGAPFSVPKDRAPESGFPDLRVRRDRCVARLTLTCADVFGLKHASIFDLTRMGEWVCVGVWNDIAKDIRDLDMEKLKVNT